MTAYHLSHGLDHVSWMGTTRKAGRFSHRSLQAPLVKPWRPLGRSVLPVWTLVNGMAFAGSNKEINRIGLAELVVSP
jgi:hypothetical protein